MLAKLLQKVFGSRNERVIRQYQSTVDEINDLESEYEALDDDALRNKTEEFRDALKDGSSLDDLLPQAFAAVRESAKRTLKMRHFDVQLLGGIALHQGNISEMQTGEGKTLVATLPAYLNALSGKGVHIVTVNDYLAKRDAQWMAPVYEFLGLSVGAIFSDLETDIRQQAYAADITYGTNNEFGFDYLRDNMAFAADERVQRKPNFAIVDEVDSILIDEARTPLIISGSVADNTELYQQIHTLIPQFKAQESEGGEGDFTLEEKSKQVFLTEDGQEKAEKLLAKKGLLAKGESLYHANNLRLIHHLNAAIRASVMFHKDVDYVVKDGQVVIIDEHTGRAMPGRRWSDGLHQAIEAKEGVTIQQESQTLASITLQNYFRLYEKLSGMTGTADTEAYEFQQIYGLEVVVIPSNKQSQRTDYDDLVFLTQAEKFEAVIEDIEHCIKEQRPVLVGTASIETSAYLSETLKGRKIKHQVLNAKFHEKEAHIIAEAGRPGAVTIATNMAGRGTDIVLGGNLEAQIAALKSPTEKKIAKLEAEWEDLHAQVLEKGGLHIIGTERHESRRIDNQLRGRSGRQGDPGSTRFYLSLDDSLMRIFASDKLPAVMKKLGMGQGEAIEHPWVNRAIEHAQRKVETYNFDLRKQLLEYDDIANEQRQIIYQQRADIMEEADISETIERIREDVTQEMVARYVPFHSTNTQWDIKGLEHALEHEFGCKAPLQKWVAETQDLTQDAVKTKIVDVLGALYRAKEEQVGSDVLRHFEKAVMLHFLDLQWREHLSSMDYLRQGIHLRGFAQKNPKQEYQKEAFELFSGMLESFKYDVVSTLYKVEVRTEEDAQAIEGQRQESAGDVEYKHSQVSPLEGGNAQKEEKHAEPYVREKPKQGRNESCACGSGKKYKHCHGRLDH